MRKTTRARPGPAERARGNFTPPGRTAEAQADPVTPAAPPGSRFSPYNWRVRTRLNAILLIPVLVAVVVGGFNVNSSVDRWQQADDAVRTAKLVRAASAYGDALINERDLTAAPLLSGERDSPQVTGARAATDRAAKQFDAAAARLPDSPDLRRRLAGFRKAEPQLATVRREAYTAKLPGVRTEEAYVAVQHPLMEFANELGFGTDNLTSYGRTLYAISLTQAAESLTRSIGTQILVEGRVPAAERGTQLTALASYAYLENIALEEYQGGGTPQDMTRLARAESAAQSRGKAQLAAAKTKSAAAGVAFVTPPDRTDMVRAIASGASPATLKAEGVTPANWMASSTLAFDAYGSVVSQLADQAEHDAASIASGAERDAISDAAVVLIGVLAAFVVASLMARSMSRRMRGLRDAAFEVAQQRLPALVEQLSRVQPGRVDTRVTAIPITSSDEIGEVARAFDHVHREAVRLAAEQALLRGNVNAVFTNLSLRNQGLVQRQLALISDLENHEADPDQLANLFKLDHLATRMRRNGENLLVLAGEEPGRRWNQPVPLVDVLRAATSEVESYERVELSGVAETEIHGAAVTDLVHLLAELLENATSFSSPHTKVNVTATRLPDGRVVVEIHDKGIGLTAQDFQEINRKLAAPPGVDAVVSRRMGLFVVGRLADRHDIRVQLRPSGERAGTTSLVMLPEPITHGGADETVESDFTVSRIVPEHHATAPAAAERPGAGAGFDEWHHEVGRPGQELAPTERSLRREGLRAALEATANEPATLDAGRPPFGAEKAVDGRYEQSYDHGYDSYRQPYEEQPAQDPGWTAYPVPGELITPAHQDPSQPEYLPPGGPQDPHGWSPSSPQGTWPPPPSSVPAGPDPLPGGPKRVGYNAPDAGPGGSAALTDAGLPRRDRHRLTPEPVTGEDHAVQEQGGQDKAAERRSTNNELWARAEQTQAPTAGGVTHSGLPKRVPRANLVPGSAQQTPQTGSLVSRAPRDVGGRLNNLRRGVQQGRGAGPDTTSSPTDSQGSGPNHQER